jgi:hypothetical protein
MAAQLMFGLGSSLVPELLAEAEVLAAAEGAALSPWDWIAHSPIRMYRGDPESGLRANETALAVAEARRDEVVASQAASQLLTARATAGRLEAPDREAQEVLERAKRSGNPVCVATAVVCCASLPLFYLAEPDFDACLSVLDASVPPTDRLLETWWRVLRGFALVGSGRPGAEEELFAALRLAERIGNASALIHALSFAALALFRRGALADALLLSSYVANFPEQVARNAGNAWVERQLDEGFSRLELGERDRLEQVGRLLSRHEVFALLARTSAGFDASPG